MKKVAIMILLLVICLLMLSCGEEADIDISAEIEVYKAQIANLEEIVIKLNEEITVKDSLIEELRKDEKQIKDQESRKQVTGSYYNELERALNFKGGYQSYTQQGPLNGNYSIERGLQTLDKIKSALDSFSAMTSLVKGRGLLDEDELNAIGNSDETTQFAEFYNMPICVKGQLMEQNYIIKALDLRRVLALYELGRVERKELDAKYDAFLYAREQYQEFVDSTFYRDSSLYPSPYYY